MGIVPQYSRIAHHTLYGSTGITFTIPPTEDFTDNTWDVNGTELFLSEIGVSEDDNKAFIRIGNNINEFKFNGATNILYADLITLVSTSSLIPDTTYFITDRNIWVYAHTTSLISNDAVRKMSIVQNTYYEISGINKGVWHSTFTDADVDVDDIMVYCGRVFKNLTGNIGSSTIVDMKGTLIYPAPNASLDNTNWVSINTTDTTYYEDKIFNIKYDYLTDTITEQSDNRGNTIYNDAFTSENISGPTNHILIDITDWGNNQIFNNKCSGVFNNHTDSYIQIAYNKCAKTISNNYSIFGNIIYNDVFYITDNKCNRIDYNVLNGFIFNNTNTGTISSNSLLSGILGSTSSISSNSNQGDIKNNTNNGSIVSNTNNGSIYNNTNNGAIDSNSSHGGTVDIYQNSNNGLISNNSTNNTGIYSNSNNGIIQSNSNNNGIYNNRCGSIYNNTNGERITNNSNSNNIFNNSNGGPIYDNSNNGQIVANSISGGIYDNSNNGHISNNTQVSGTCNIEHNNNNGDIIGARTASVTGTIVNI